MKLNIPEFKDNKDLIAYLIANKTELIDIKKSAIKHADPFSGIISSGAEFVSKAQTNNQDTEDTIYRTIVGNTYNWMDSHDDVHVGNTFGVSLNHNKGRVYHRHDHVPMLTAKVGKFSDVYEQQVKWTDLGVNKAGYTTSLLGDSAIKKAYNQLIFDSYKDGEIDRHSVGMIYVKIDLAVNNPDNKEEYSEWNKYINLLGNPDKALKKGYFWAVKEAKLIEISCVTDGSNELTGIYNPAKASLKIDPVISSQELKELINNAFKN